MLQQDAVSLIENLDPAIFEVDSTTSPADRVSLLIAQRMIRCRGLFSYLEIGSYLGGTLLPYLLDPQCELVVSIDKRPDSQPDERAERYVYNGITTSTMIDRLRPFLSVETMGKLRTIDADASQVSPASIGSKIDVALIDGEHTVTATFSDFISVLPAMKPDGLVLFHDTNLIIDALENICCHMRSLCFSHQLFLVPDHVGVIALGSGQAPARIAFGPTAHDKRTFTSNAKRALYERIASSVAKGAHLNVWPT